MTWICSQPSQQAVQGWHSRAQDLVGKTVRDVGRPSSASAPRKSRPGIKRCKDPEQNYAALYVRLGAGDIENRKKAFPLGITAGTRYPEKQITALKI